jgi:hypothetical protein
MGKDVRARLLLPGVESFHMLPSVMRGPVDISKARTSFKFQPEKLDTVLAETIGWYDAELKSNLKFLDESLMEWGEQLFESDEEMDRILSTIFENTDGLFYEIEYYGEETDEF